MEGLDAAKAAFEVGYESASQFNREYRRFLGQERVVGSAWSSTSLLSLFANDFRAGLEHAEQRLIGLKEWALAAEPMYFANHSWWLARKTIRVTSILTPDLPQFPET